MDRTLNRHLGPPVCCRPPHAAAAAAPTNRPLLQQGPRQRSASVLAPALEFSAPGRQRRASRWRWSGCCARRRETSRPPLPQWILLCLPILLHWQCRMALADNLAPSNKAFGQPFLARHLWGQLSFAGHRQVQCGLLKEPLDCGIVYVCFTLSCLNGAPLEFHDLSVKNWAKPCFERS